MTLVKLPLLEDRRDTLEKCVYCPKLCRASCPVATADPTERVTPWGKMSMAYFVGRGDVPMTADFAEPAWACSGCFGCTKRCDHGNDVATTLIDARAGLFEAGVAPGAARAAVERHAARSDETRRNARAIAPSGVGRAKLLVGCGYLRKAPREAELAVRVAERLVGAPVTPVEACCGLPLLYAGDRKGFVDQANQLAREVAAAGPLVALDPGCARALLVEYPRLGVLVAEPTLLVDLAELALPELAKAPGQGAIRYHDPCQLGRGLGRFDGPRRILEKVTGSAPLEFQRSRETAECSGGGGLMPVTMPETSRRMADLRIDEHARRGGGTIVTGCASSLRRFRAQGADAEDLITYIARGLGIESAHAPTPTEHIGDGHAD